jgi:exocyst complex protein 7
VKTGRQKIADVEAWLHAQYLLSPCLFLSEERGDYNFSYYPKVSAKEGETEDSSEAKSTYSALDQLEDVELSSHSSSANHIYPAPQDYLGIWDPEGDVYPHSSAYSSSSSSSSSSSFTEANETGIVRVHPAFAKYLYQSAQDCHGFIDPEDLRNSSSSSFTGAGDIGTPKPREPISNKTMSRGRDAQFAEERAEVEVLLAEAAKSENLSKRIKASMARLESGAHVVKDAIGPVFTNTQELQTVNRNVDSLLDVIDKILASSEDKGREERIIRGGPGAVGLTEYLASLRRIDRTLSQMSTSNLRVNQQAIGDFNELLSQGNNMLQSLFRSLLTENIQPVEPLHYITKQLPFPTIPPETVSKLKSIEAFISSPPARDASYNQRESPSIRLYCENRGPYLSSSLQNLSTASINTSKKKIADEIYRHGTSGIGTYASGIEGIFLAEFHNISAIFPSGDWGIAFEATCRKALAEFAKTLRELNMHIKANLTTDCFLAYEIVEAVTNLSFRLDSKTGELKLPFAEALKPVRETAKSSLSELLDGIRRRISSMVALPLDGAAIPFTTEIMTRLQFMTLYTQALSSIMASLGDGNWTSPASAANSSSTSLPSVKSFDVGPDGNQLLAHYILDNLEALVTSLETKARLVLKSKAVLGVFLANNVAVIDRMIRSSDLAPVLKSSPTASSKIDSWRKKGNQAYLDSWREPCSALMDVQYTNRGARPPSGSNGIIDSASVVKALGSKDKDAIKEKFKSFNTSFDDLSAKHRQLNMEREVRSQLGREVQAMIEPLYARFWDRYHEIDKGKGKYVKYDKGSLAAQLANLG